MSALVVPIIGEPKYMAARLATFSRLHRAIREKRWRAAYTALGVIEGRPIRAQEPTPI